MASHNLGVSGSKPIIWIIGGPGSGKSTLCERLSKSLSFTHLSTGELLRKEVTSGTRRGEEVFKLMQAGEIVCSILVADLLSEALQKNRDSEGFMIDGFPMDVEQAEAFVREVGPPTKVIFLRANPVVLKGRLISRNNFDDSLESITRRLKNFVERTRPIVSKFNAIIVDAEKSTSDIVQEVLRQIQKTN